MMSVGLETRRFLFLQGPHGAFFAHLAQAIRDLGFGVERINLNGGDKHDWVGDAVDFRGRKEDWPLFFDDFVVSRGVTDLILYGDCRDLHSAAHGLAVLRRLRVHVMEDGYIRPDFLTLEENGVNGNSALPRDPDWYRAEAQLLPPIEATPAVPSSFRQRFRNTTRYALATWLYWLWFPHYRTHRTSSLAAEAIGWMVQIACQRAQERRSQQIWEAVREQKYFVLPLQLDSDYQLRVHSPFPDMRTALHFVIKSFGHHAPSDTQLLIKRHPLDAGILRWGSLVARLARRYGVADRVHYIQHGDIADVVRGACGIVTVNSTVGTLALNHAIPVAVLGRAVYGLEEIVDVRSLDEFWPSPYPPDVELYDCFCRVLLDRCLIRGGLLSEEGMTMLVSNALPRLSNMGTNIKLRSN